MKNLRSLYNAFDGIIEELKLSPFHTENQSKSLVNKYPYFCTSLRIYAQKSEKHEYVVTKFQNTPFQNLSPDFKGKVIIKFEQIMYPLLLDVLNIFEIRKRDITHILVSNANENVKIDFYIKKKYSDMKSHELSYYYFTDKFNEILSTLLNMLTTNHLSFDMSTSDFKTFTNEYYSKLHCIKEQVIVMRDQSQGITWEKHQVINTGIDSVMAYFHTKYKGYLDPTIPIPNKMRISFLKQYQTPCDSLIQKILRPTCPIIIRNTILDILDSLRCKSFTEIEQLYFEVFFATFGRVFQKHTANTQDNWYIFSITVNLNTKEIYEEIINHWIVPFQDQQYTELFEKWDKIETISPVKYAFDTTATSLQKQLRHYFEDTIVFTDNEPMAAQLIPSSFVPQIINSTSKIRTKLTVEELAICLRLCFDTGLLKGAKHNCFKTLPLSINTDGSKEFTSGNIKKYYYNTPRNSLNVVEQYLIKLISTLQRFRS